MKIKTELDKEKMRQLHRQYVADPVAATNALLEAAEIIVALGYSFRDHGMPRCEKACEVTYGNLVELRGLILLDVQDIDGF